MLQLPSSVDDVTAKWLGDVLTASGALGAGDRITWVGHQPLGVGTGLLSDLHRVSYRCASGGERSVVVKLSCRNELRSTVDQLGLYRREVDFYQQLAGVVPLRTPAAHLAVQAEGSTDFVLVLEDFGGLLPADQLSGLGLDAAGVAIDAIARLHAWAWGDDRRLQDLCAAFESICCDATRALYPTFFAGGWASYLAHAEREPDEALNLVAAGWVDALPWFLDALAAPATLCHGDYRADNLFFDTSDGSVSVIDFQLMHQGCGISDIAYLVSQSVEEATLDDHERLVRRYCTALEACGVVYPWPEAWRQYRIAVLFHVVEAVVATLTWPSLDERGRRLVLRLVERAARAIEVVDAASLLPRQA